LACLLTYGFYGDSSVIRHGEEYSLLCLKCIEGHIVAYLFNLSMQKYLCTKTFAAFYYGTRL
jgi:hypothetical protein